MRKFLLLLLIPFALCTQKANAQDDELAIREGIGALVAAKMLSTYSVLTTSVKSHLNATGAARDTFFTHLAMLPGVISTSTEYLVKMKETDMFTEEDVDFLDKSVQIFKKIGELAAYYISFNNGDKTKSMDQFYKVRATVRRDIFDLLEIESDLDY